MAPANHPDRIRWRQLLPGLLFGGTVIAAMVLVLRFAQIGGVSGDTYTLYAGFDRAFEVLPNTEVWLNGSRVGVVEAVYFAPPSVDTSRRVLVRMAVRADAQRFIRRDAVAQVRTGATLLGAPVVYLTGSSPSIPATRDGDTLRTLPTLDAEIVEADLRQGLGTAGEILGDFRTLAVSIQGTRDSIRALVGAPRPGEDRAVSFRQLRRSVAAFGRLRGTLNLTRTDPALVRRVERLTALTDSLQRLVVDDTLVLPRVRADVERLDALADDILREARVVAELAEERAALLPPNSVWDEELLAIRTALDALIADLRRRPWRYLPF